MKKMVILIIFFSTFLYGKEPKTKEIYDAFSGQGCLVFEGYQKTSGGGTLKFRNKCGIALNVIVCVTYPSGKKEILRNRNRIFKKNTWTVAITGLETPSQIEWSVDPNEPKLPPSCGD